jgi:exopolyphosphatase / guanosine-5'-triphosphate,3'-diphosphate pyrophosphatase
MKKIKKQLRGGVIVIGSDSIRLLIGEKKSKSIKILEFLRSVLPIGKDTFHKERISQEMINRSIGILHKYSSMLKEYQISDFRVIATTAVREASNRDVFLDTITRKTGFRIEIFTPGDIVYYLDTYLYHRLKDKYPIHDKNVLIAELGAGSVEVSLMEKGYIQMSIGIPLGTLAVKQLFERMHSHSQEAFDALREYIGNELGYLKRIMPSISIDDIILTGENLAYCFKNILQDKSGETGFFPLTRERAQELISRCEGKMTDELVSLYNLPVEIAETADIFPLIVNSFFSLTKKKHIYILETSLPEAILSHNILKYDLSKKYKRIYHLVSMARALCKKFDVDLNHVHFVADLATFLFTSLRKHLGLEKSDLLYLILATYLHDIGMFISNRSHHKHSEYIINALNLFRLSEDDQKIIAGIARYHRKSPPAPSHLIYKSLTHKKQIIVQKLSALLRIANSLDRSHRQKIKKLKVKFTKEQDIVLYALVDDNFILENMAFEEKKVLFEEITGNKIHLKTINKSLVVRKG